MEILKWLFSVVSVGVFVFMIYFLALLLASFEETGIMISVVIAIILCGTLLYFAIFN